MSLRRWLAIAFAALFIVTAIRPWNVQDFVIEHLLTAAGLTFLIWVDRRRRFSTLSVVLIFVFLVQHLIGAHYTYSEVPYDTWSEWLLGSSISDWIGTTRNHYDRMVHLSFGLLMLLPMREFLREVFPELRPCDVRLLLVAVLVLAFLSKVYELMEWGFTLVMTQAASATYNGEQGDIRDAHKDMALALAGALVSAIVVFIVDRRGQSEKTSPSAGE